MPAPLLVSILTLLLCTTVTFAVAVGGIAVPPGVCGFEIWPLPDEPINWVDKFAAAPANWFNALLGELEPDILNKFGVPKFNRKQNNVIVASSQARSSR